LTKKTWLSPVHKTAVRSFASLLIVLSGLAPLSDKIISVEIANLHGYPNSVAFIWALFQTLAPILMAFGALLNSYKIAYSVPIYLYSIQLYWVFDASLTLDDVLLHVYAAGFVFSFIFIVIIINNFFNKAFQEQNAKLTFLEKALDLSINLSRKS
jgi:hypothetical protein